MCALKRMQGGEAALWIILAILAVVAAGILIYACVAPSADRARPSSSESAAVIAGATVSSSAPVDAEQSAAFLGGGAKWSSSAGVGPAGLCKHTVWLPETIVAPPARASRR